MPAAMTNKPSRNAQYVPMLTAGINQKAPAAINDSPTRMPPL